MATCVSGSPLIEKVSPPDFGEVEEAADVVVLVVAGEQALDFGAGERKGGEGHRLAELAPASVR